MSGPDATPAQWHRLMVGPIACAADASPSIGGHTDAVGSDAFNQNLSERRAATVRWYLVDNFKLPSANLHSVGFGKRRPKNKADVFAPENRRVEIVNETQAQAQR